MQITMYGLFTALAALLAVGMLFWQRRGQGGGARVAALDLALCCIPAAFVGARLLYCLFRADFYLLELGPLSILRTWEGGFLLYGGALGALGAAAWLARRAGVSVAATLDELAAPGLLAVAVCRLGERFTPEGVGPWVEQPWLCRFPFAVRNEYGEWQLAVFIAEALCAVIILLHVRRMRRAAPGDAVLRALLLYACCQVLLESLRMDGCLRIGFVRVSQALSGLVILAVAMIAARRRGEGRGALARGGLVLALCAAVGGLEWALDKTAVSNLLIYAVMAALCAALAAAALVSRRVRRG